MVTWGERVVATGTAAELSTAFPGAERVDLDGFVIPGLNDAHAHPTMTAENLLHVNCSPELVSSEDALVDVLRAEASALASGQWLRGSRYDESKTTGGRVVDRWFLDAAVPDRPVLLIHVAGPLGRAQLGRPGRGRPDRRHPRPARWRPGPRRHRTAHRRRVRAGPVRPVLSGAGAPADGAAAVRSGGPPAGPRPGAADVPRRRSDLDDRRAVRPGRRPAAGRRPPSR
jgi:hypothetical protein